MKKNYIKLFFVVTAFTASFFAFSQSTSFNDISFVKLGPDDGSEYDVYEIGSDTQSYTARRWITTFYMNRYETTYDLWYRIKIKAEKAGYKFANDGQEGSMGRRGAPPSKGRLSHPVTMISWYDAIIWCNAFSEQSGKKPCYTFQGEVLKDSSETAKLDIADCDWESNGYRLPTEAEWEYAARKTKSGFQNGSLASGQVDENGNDDTSIPEDELAWSSNNADRTRTVGTAGTPFSPDAPPEAGSGNPNAMGIFDMSGNVNEYCWDWFSTYKDIIPGKRAIGIEFGTQRVCRGGSWSPYTPFFYCGDRYSYEPSEAYDYMGFRIVTSK